MKYLRNERGMALLILVAIIVLAATGYLLKSIDSGAIKNERDKRTTESLAEAKAALLGFAAAQNLTISPLCGTNCARPGDLPCPDMNNDGIAEGSCGNAAGTTQQANRLGRLPWITLGLSDLRDGDGERLWYAVSSRYKLNTRFRPLNSDTNGTITLRTSSGNLINDATSNNGLVAIVIAPGANIERQDNFTQVRNGINQLITSNYLDVALGEDNQNFIDANTNGFIMGEVKDANGKTIVNDHILAISREEINQVMETRVLAEVERALTDYYAGVGGFSFPRPASFNLVSCLGNANINAPNCPEGLLTHGRIPANPNTPWDITSILRGGVNGNWFQLNAWREVIHYSVATACVTGTANCDGVGFLTLNNAQLPPTNNKQLILIATGSAIGSQVRVTNANKTIEANYLEGENLLPSPLLPIDDMYSRTIPLTQIINDRAISLP